MAKFVIFTVLLLADVPGAYASARPLGQVETRLWDSVSAGANHTCQLMGDGTVRCWGGNTRGQLGDGTFSVDRLSPVPVANLSSVKAIAAGLDHTCALRSDGSVSCWGRNDRGQLGQGTTTDQPSAHPVGSLSGVVAIAAGDFHSCALTLTHTVLCWGFNSNGQLGDGTTTQRLTPVSASGLIFNVNLPHLNVVALTAGGAHTCALLADSSARCWGANGSGQLGDGTTTQRLAPALVSGLFNVVALDAGGAHTCALLVDGTARCWGENSSGQLGNFMTTDNLTPGLVFSLTGAVAIAAGSAHTCALLADGTAKCWGANLWGQVGDGTITLPGRLSPVPVGFADGVAISGGSSHTCAVKANGTASCWGRNDSGQLGNGSTTQSLTPFPIFFPSPGFSGTVVEAGGLHTCAARADGTAACWGRNLEGQLGNGSTTSRSTPAAVSGLSGVIALAAGELHTCALLANGTARCWGFNGSGQLGDGTVIQRTTPVVVSGLSGAIALSAGGSHTCALLADGTARCWGDNSFGQLGDGSATSHALPVFVAGGGSLVAIAAGNAHTCALRSYGEVNCWGKNVSGQLGDGTTVNRSVPVALVGLTLIDASHVVVAITAGDNHTCALLPDATARCWGDNSQGQLGDGTTSNRLTPATVGGLTNATAIAGGRLHTCALRSFGFVFCWGSNANGQLGNNTTTNRLTPGAVIRTPGTTGGSGRSTPVLLSGMLQLTTGGDHTCALESNGGPLCWGDNVNGQIGNSATTDQLLPVTVPSFSLNIDPAVSLGDSRRVATVNIIATCEAGRHLHLAVTLSQDPASGFGVGHGQCTGALERYPVTVPAQGRDRFATGPAEVSAQAVIQERGAIVDEQAWTRQVNLATGP